MAGDVSSELIMSMIMGRQGVLDGAAWEYLISCVTSVNKGIVNWSMLIPNRTCRDRTAARYVCAVEALRSCDKDVTKNASVSTEAGIGATETFSHEAKYTHSPNEYVARDDLASAVVNCRTAA